jgi:hypothetical protein
LINPLASSDVQAFISPYWPNSLFIKSLSDSIPSSVSDTVSMLPLPFHLLFFCVLRKSLYYALPSRNCPSWNNMPYQFPSCFPVLLPFTKVCFSNKWCALMMIREQQLQNQLFPWYL